MRGCPRRFPGYDAFGRRRNADWSDDPGGTQMATPSDWNHHGYTGHEMLDNVALVHMKGRVYDPTLEMFLSPDPVLNDLRMPQSLNPYGYVAGNPLSFTDPTGYGLRSFFKRLVRGRWIKHLGPKIIEIVVYVGCNGATGGEAERGCAAIANSVGQMAASVTKSQTSSGASAPGKPNLGQFGGGYGGYGGNGSLMMNFSDPTIAVDAYDLVVTTGDSIGAIIAVIHGLATKNETLTTEGVEGLRQHRKDYVYILAGIVNPLPGSSGRAIRAATEALPSLGKQGAKEAARGAGRATTDFIDNVTVVSRGKVIGRGTVDVRATVEGIQSGKLSPRDVFRNDQGLLPPQRAGYYQEFYHPTPGFNSSLKFAVCMGAVLRS